MRITAAVLDGSGPDPVLREVELDDPRADEVLVRLDERGISRHHLHFARQQYRRPPCSVTRVPAWSSGSARP